MPELKLAKLPDRTPIKIAFKASPDLAQMLNGYCGLYRAVYQQPDETVEELIPFMLAAFLDSDKGFARARKEAPLDSPPEPERPRRGRRPSSQIPSTSSTEE
jgi:hypothetical protein